MWEYVAFFGYNLIFFLFALVVWYAFPKPPPYDYTTIPGLKRDPTDETEEMVNEMRSCVSINGFLDQLHDDYGPLASFYWGSRYVVTVGSSLLWRDLTAWTRKTAYRVDVIPFNSRDAVAPGVDWLREIARELNGGQWTNESQAEAVRMAFGGCGDQNSREQLKQRVTQYECDTVQFSYDNVAKWRSADDAGTENQNKTRLALIWRALRRCLSSAVLADVEALDEESADGDWSVNSSLRSAALETIRLAIPFEHLFYSFDGDIDLDGHPIPAQVPIVLCVRRASCSSDSTKFKSDRFLQNNTVTRELADSLQKLPYFDVLVSAVTAQLTRRRVLSA